MTQIRSTMKIDAVPLFRTVLLQLFLALMLTQSFAMLMISSFHKQQITSLGVHLPCLRLRPSRALPDPLSVEEWNPFITKPKYVSEVFSLPKTSAVDSQRTLEPSVLRKCFLQTEDGSSVCSLPIFEEKAIQVPIDYTVDQCITFLRSLHNDEVVHAEDSFHDLDRLYVTENCKLVGYAPLTSLLVSNGDISLTKLLKQPEVVVKMNDDLEDILDKVQESEVSQAPVVDESGNLVGVLTPQRLMKEMEAEATDDMMRYSGSGGGESYFGTSLRRLVWSRGLWLVSLMALQSLSSAILTKFSAVIERNIVLALFLTMLTGSAGNAGNQSSAMVIRGLAVGEINKTNAWKVIWREAKGAFLLGLLLSVTSFARVITTKGATKLSAMVVSFSMGLTVIGAVVMGTIVPIILERFGMDPVNFASPALATLTDVAGVLVLCSLSSVIL